MALRKKKVFILGTHCLGGDKCKFEPKFSFTAYLFGRRSLVGRATMTLLDYNFPAFRNSESAIATQSFL